MKHKPIILSAAARGDASNTALYYATEAGADIARAFVAELEKAHAKIAEHPSLGSPRYAHELSITGLRSHKFRRFPYMVFYMESADQIKVWRILHTARDMAAWLAD